MDDNAITNRILTLLDNDRTNINAISLKSNVMKYQIIFPNDPDNALEVSVVVCPDGYTFHFVTLHSLMEDKRPDCTIPLSERSAKLIFNTARDIANLNERIRFSQQYYNENTSDILENMLK